MLVEKNKIVSRKNLQNCIRTMKSIKVTKRIINEKSQNQKIKSRNLERKLQNETKK